MALPCKDCAAGTLHEGTPAGRVERVHGLETYIADPPNGQQPKGIIVHIPDAFGWELVNNRILSDNYATRTGCRVYLPEFMDGHWMSWDLLNAIDTVMKPATWTETLGKMYVETYLQIPTDSLI